MSGRRYVRHPKQLRAFDLADDPPVQLDGRLSTFELVSEGDRAEARTALQHETPHALPKQFGHALGLYPECPARWLYEDWLTDHEPDPASESHCCDP